MPQAMRSANQGLHLHHSVSPCHNNSTCYYSASAHGLAFIGHSFDHDDCPLNLYPIPTVTRKLVCAAASPPSSVLHHHIIVLDQARQPPAPEKSPQLPDSLPSTISQQVYLAPGGPISSVISEKVLQSGFLGSTTSTRNARVRVPSVIKTD